MGFASVGNCGMLLKEKQEEASHDNLEELLLLNQ